MREHHNKLAEHGADGEREASIKHDEAFKKLLEVFFKEFIELFFPELAAVLDYSETRFLMQELLVDIVGEEARELDLLLETRYKGMEGHILIHLEPQSYRDKHFHVGRNTCGWSCSFVHVWMPRNWHC